MKSFHERRTANVDQFLVIPLATAEDFNILSIQGISLKKITSSNLINLSMFSLSLNKDSIQENNFKSFEMQAIFIPNQ